MSDKRWHFDRGEQHFGPVSTEQLEEMIIHGEIEERQIVWCEQEDGGHTFVRALTATHHDA
jgi:hypothetical protein